MARKGNQPKNGVAHHSSNHKKRVTDSGCAQPGTKGRTKAAEVKDGSGEELSNGSHSRNPSINCVNKAECVGDVKKGKQESHRFPQNAQRSVGAMEDVDEMLPNGSNLDDCVESTHNTGASGTDEENRTLSSNGHGKKYAKKSFGCCVNGLHTENGMENLNFSDPVEGRNLRSSTLSALKAASEWLDTVVSGNLRTTVLFILEAAGDWLERRKPLFSTLSSNILKAYDYARVKMEHIYPIILRWFMHFGNIILLLSMVWLDCSLRGIDSFLRMGTTSFFSVIWCSIFSVIAMIGISKFLLVLVIAALIGVFIGLTLAIFIVAISGTILLWFYGSFLTTMLVTFIGGLAFALNHERLALLVTTVYSVYCAWTYVGWIGLLLGLNLSFVSSDVLIYFLKNNISEHRRPNRAPEQKAGMRDQAGFYNEQVHASSEAGPGHSQDRSPGVPSTSGADSEITSEDEVIRLLNCTDHYSALGLPRFVDVDVSLLKREYKKKAMLVHPDKNMGNEKAAEAFKKLQNAYEVLLDSFKRKAYDDELRREELLNCFRRFQTASQKNVGHGFFGSGFTHTGGDSEDLLGESRRITCKKCGNFHIWVHINKSKSRARWCQDCKDFHQAKDGDGWVEQSSQPFFFGLLQKVDVPSAYVCAESKIYDATEWYICQGMRCPANTHKPSFHVNTSITSKHNNGKGTSSGHRGGGVPTYAEESMTEEELFEWLQNAMQAGMFETSGGSTSTRSPHAKAENRPKSGGSNSGSSSKRKKKGKRQW
ncbi:uncharacterized protein LOC131151721 [Malania oleifera]|uniref:uncharacterized protein LOC131151721 n=1 Tax=Malania oleifera TaxID=397392 RepID=UPI0025AEC251|nr:uncharacterized protein LOC131151721 [Malania oleifera]